MSGAIGELEKAKMYELRKRKIMLRKDLLDLEDEIRDVGKEIKRSTPSLWHKIKRGMKKLWSKLFHRTIETPKPLNIKEEESLISTPPSHPSLLVTPAIDTPSKKIVRPTPSFVDRLENGSVLTLFPETLTESHHDQDGSYLERFRSPHPKVAVAPASSWVQDVLGSSVTSGLVTSTLEIPELASDDLDTSHSLSRGESSEDLYLYCHRS